MDPSPPLAAATALVAAPPAGQGVPPPSSVELTPAQQATRDQLLELGGPRPTFERALQLHLLGLLEEGLAPVADALGERDLSVRKAELSQVHQCELQHVRLAETPFAWNAATARGTVLHKALELSVTRPSSLSPAALVDAALDRIIDAGNDWTPRTWLLAADDAELVELRCAVEDLLAKFQDSFPPLERDWRPRVESPLVLSLCGGRIQLRGKPDLMLGRPRGTTARVLIVDFKSGIPRTSHLDDLRFYALLEAVRVGVPPFRVASYYLDAGRWHGEDVTVEALEASVRRVVDGVTALAALRDGRTPTASPGLGCGTCPARSGCPSAIVVDRATGEVVTPG